MQLNSPINYISILFFLVSTISTVSSQSPSKLSKFEVSKITIGTQIHKIDSLLQLYHTYGHFNGSILVAKEGKVLYKRGFGEANKEWNNLNEVDTKFRLASVTKQFTAMLTMQLVARGELDLKANISTYLPDYPNKSGDSINLHHLLSHTSGIPNYTSFPNYQKEMRIRKTTRELIQNFADSTLQFNPGERFSYSNSGYIVLGAIIEKVTGRSLQNVLKEQILEPLGMNNTGFDQTGMLLDKRANAYYQNGTNFKNANFIDMSMAYTAGGMYSTVEDLYKWDQALYTEKLLPKTYSNQLFAKHVEAWGQHYGYGWFIGEQKIGNTSESIASINHDGVINGFASLILRIPSTKSSVILLTNVSGCPTYRIASSIIGILLNKPYDFPKKSLSSALAQIIADEGIETARNLYPQMKASSKYDFQEHKMNIVAYEYIERDQLVEAEFILKENLNAHPHSSNAYDSYGEILLKLGKKNKAIENYKKSVEYNPKNENARSILKELGITDGELELLTLELLKADKTWTHEIFHFPLHFAPEMKLTGREDARFPRGWRNEKSSEFWSYTFAWYVDEESEITLTELESNLRFYFDGLMELVNKEKDRILPKTISTILQNSSSDGRLKVNGFLNIHDSFVTRNAMKLYFSLEERPCAEENKTVLHFRFSPKSFDHEIWSTLNSVKIREQICP